MSPEGDSTAPVARGRVPEGITLYVVRHGQTEFNAERRIAGQRDSRLTALGRKQAASNGRVLKELIGDLSPVEFIASPLHRACTTMELLLETAGLPLTAYHTDHRLMERDYGDWNGRQIDDLNETDDQERRRHKDWWQFRPPGGETAEEVYARVAAFAASLTRDTVCVSHSGASIMLRGLAMGLTPDKIRRLRQPNHGVVRLSGGTETMFGD